MGGKGSGGARVGSGRKAKSVAAKVFEGTATVAERRHAGARTPPPVAPAVPKRPALDEFDAPNDLSRDERLVWLDLAPHAIENQTLVPATAFSFKLLCRNIVLERKMADSASEAGGPSHRGIIQRVDAELLRFGLSPIGKPMVKEPDKPADPFAEFEQGPVQ